MSKDYVIREHECREMTGLCRTTRYLMEIEGTFPKRIQLGGRAVGWKLSEIQKWIDSSPVVDKNQMIPQGWEQDRWIRFGWWQKIKKLSETSIKNVNNDKKDMYSELLHELEIAKKMGFFDK
ncbi:helix-turn-helix transcriptional regulator [Enterobacter hormaechei]|uniref:helix-turn-helix transcriptional regulator n=1 Tax=Enterobacter hormaechei TaxID=158836 RepID=UPI003EBF5412